MEKAALQVGDAVTFDPARPVAAVTGHRALGQERAGLAVLGHALLPSAGIDGVLGPDFFRERSLTIDFRAGRMTLKQQTIRRRDGPCRLGAVGLALFEFAKRHGRFTHASRSVRG